MPTRVLGPATRSVGGLALRCVGVCGQPSGMAWSHRHAGRCCVVSVCVGAANAMRRRSTTAIASASARATAATSKLDEDDALDEGALSADNFYAILGISPSASSKVRELSFSCTLQCMHATGDQVATAASRAAAHAHHNTPMRIFCRTRRPVAPPLPQQSLPTPDFRIYVLPTRCS
jgi:hypothetical protein